MRRNMESFVRMALVGALVCTLVWAAGARSDTPVSGVVRAAAGDPAPAEFQATAVSAGKVKPPASGAYIGVYKPNVSWTAGALTAYAQEASNKRPALLSWYQAWYPESQYSPNFNAAEANSAFAHGVVPLITWEPWKPGAGVAQSAYQLADINAGTYDGYIRAWAKAIKAVGGPVMMRPMHEMNGSWYPWCGSVNGNSPAQFVKAWRRMHGIFKSEGVTNVTWVWSINGLSSPDTYEYRYAAFYPGDAYVDWTSISGYNWGTSRPKTKWQSFETIYAKPYAYLRSVGKPIVITEMGSVPNGGNKAAWIKHTYAAIRSNYPLVKGVVYFDKLEHRNDATCDWRIAGDPRSARAYRRAVADPFYVAAPATTLSGWQATLAP